MAELRGRVSTRGGQGNPTWIAVAKNLNSSGILTGQLVMSGSAQQLPAGALLNGIEITAKSTNTAPILIGGANVANVSDGTGGGHVLEAGGTFSYAVQDASMIYVIGTSGDILSWGGS